MLTEKYGMFCILVPVCMAPSIAVLFWADWKAKKLGGQLAISFGQQILMSSALPCLVFVCSSPRPGRD
jgi:hypothetical protein